MIIALAGRRIDAPDATVRRFPLANVPLVEARLEALLRQCEASAIVSSAACGADLIAQRVAISLGLQCTVVLPYPAPLFKERSVIDRPGEWGREFDRVIAHAHRHGSLIELNATAAREASAQAYRLANEAILDAALSAARSSADVLAVIVWEGQSRGADDLTAAFAESARARALVVDEVSTAAKG